MIDVCLITDSGYAAHTFVCIKSLMLSKNKNSKYFVHVILDVNGEEFNILNKKFTSLSRKNFRVECIKQSSEKYLRFELTGFHVKAADLLKFDLMNIFSGLDKILYLDGDIIVKKDLSELYSVELDDNYFAANYHAPSQDETKHRLGLDLDHVYNAGVLLFNLKKMRDDNLYETLINTRKTNKYILQAKSLDQLTFNYVCKRYIKKFDPKHHLMFRNNWQLKLYNSTYKTNYKHFNQVIDDVTLIHFVGKDCKPWYDNAKAHDLWQYCEEEDSLEQLKVYDSSNIKELVPLSKHVIAFSFDSNLIDQTAVAIASLLSNTKDKCHIICLIAPDVCVLHRARIVHKLKWLKDKCDISFVNVESVLGKSFDNAFVRRGITKPAYYRLFMDKLLSNFKTVVYSDIDVVFKKDVFDVLSMLKQNKAFYAVPSVNLSSRSKNYGTHWEYYFNSGFLVINIDRLKRLDRSEDVECLIGQALTFQDQDILNKVFPDEIGKLPPTFCLIPMAYTIDSKNKYAECYYKGLFTKEEVDQLTDPYIIHYAGIKPWNDEKTYMASEWQIYCDLIFKGNIEKAQEVKSAEVDIKITRTDLADLIGKEYLIKRIAGIKSNQIDIKQYLPCCVLRSFDLQNEVVLSSRDEFNDINKKKAIIELKRKSPILLVEQYLHGAFDVSVDAWFNLYHQDIISYEKENEILILARKLFANYPQFRFIDFLLVGDKLYFKRFRNE